MMKMFTDYHGRLSQAKCSACGRQSPLLTSILGACVDCIWERPEEVLPHIQEMQAETRLEFDLPTKPPDDPRACTVRFAPTSVASPRASADSVVPGRTEGAS